MDKEAQKAYAKLRRNPPIRYCVFNFDSPWGLHYYRRDAIKDAEEISGEPWKKCSKYLQIRKVRIVVLPKK